MKQFYRVSTHGGLWCSAPPASHRSFGRRARQARQIPRSTFLAATYVLRRSGPVAHLLKKANSQNGSWTQAIFRDWSTPKSPRANPSNLSRNHQATKATRSGSFFTTSRRWRMRVAVTWFSALGPPRCKRSVDMGDRQVQFANNR